MKDILKFFQVLALTLLISGTVFAQRTTISGYVEDANSGEALIGVNILVVGSSKGTTTNNFGFYSISLPAREQTLRFSYVGYAPQTHVIQSARDTTLTIRLIRETLMDEVTITGERMERIEDRSQMSRIDIPIETIKTLPVILGETDIIKSIQLLPGVQSGTEGASGLYVRGGSPDQNLILLDGVPVYNVSHLFGFFSVFNADAIRNVNLTKGGFPARYGGRTSAVLDISMKEGNNQEFRGQGGISPIAARLTLEGPIGDERTSFMVSARRTYLDILMRPFIKNTLEDESLGYYFWDLNAKINHRLDNNNRLYLSLYGGDDRFYSQYKYTSGNYTSSYNDDLSWGNITSALRWNHLFSNRLFSNMTLIYSRYQFQISSDYTSEQIFHGEKFRDEYKLRYFSGIQDWGLRYDMDFLPDPNHYIRMGSSVTWQQFSPGGLTFRVTENTNETESLDIREEQYGLHYTAYVENDHRVRENLKINYGLHYGGFATDRQHYFSLEPRVSSSLKLYWDVALKASYAYMTQYLHLLTNSGIGLPTDLWVPVTKKVAPQTSHLVAVGLAKTILNDQYEVSLEVYHKWMDGLIEYSEGSNFINLTSSWDSNVETGGKGWSKGVELFVQRRWGKTTGWLGYTLAQTDRQFEHINQGKRYPFRYDRRHDISLVVSHKISDRIHIGGTWVYGTGTALTMPLGEYRDNITGTSQSPYDFSFGNYFFRRDLEYYSDRNAFRMQPYHRLDAGIQFHKDRSWGKRIWSVDVYNAYNRKNPFFMYLEYDYNRQKTIGRQVSLFPLIPSISYNFSF